MRLNSKVVRIWDVGMDEAFDGLEALTRDVPHELVRNGVSMKVRDRITRDVFSAIHTGIYICLKR